MARGAKTMSARPPPQAWLANCLDPTARVVTVSAKELGAMIEAREAKTPKSAPRATAKRSRGEGSFGAKYTVVETEGYVWMTCTECSKKRYAPEDKVEDTKEDAKFKCELMRSETRPDVSCDTPEDSFPRTNFNIEGVVAPPPGWRREVIPRKTVNGADAYYYSPCGKRMRSKPDVQRFLDKCKEQGKYVDVGIESFDFHTGGRGDAKKDGKKAEKSDEKPAKREKADDDGDDDKESSKKKQKGGTSKGDTKQKEDIPVKRGRGRPKRVMEAVKEKEEEKEDVDMADA